MTTLHTRTAGSDSPEMSVERLRDELGAAGGASYEGIDAGGVGNTGAERNIINNHNASGNHNANSPNTNSNTNTLPQNGVNNGVMGSAMENLKSLFQSANEKAQGLFSSTFSSTETAMADALDTLFKQLDTNGDLNSVLAL
jgi:hypothetical protein